MYKYGGFESNELYSHQNSLTGQKHYGETAVECIFMFCQKMKVVFCRHFNNNMGEAQKQRQNSFSHKVWQQLG